MTLNEIRKEMKLHEETKDLVLNDADLLKVKRYLDLKDKVVDGLTVRLKTEPYLEIVYVPTANYEDEQNKEKLKNHLKVFNSDVYLQDASLHDFDAFNKERKNILNEINNFLSSYKKNEYEKGLYISGKYGTGKTYLISAIAHELAKRNVDVLIVFMPDLVRNIRGGISDGNLEENINKLKQVDVLMFDDIGGENMTPWFRDEIFLPILQYRLSARLTTFFTSNLEMSELVNYYSPNRNNESDYIKSMRVVRRIQNLTKYIKLNEEQYKNDWLN